MKITKGLHLSKVLKNDEEKLIKSAFGSIKSIFERCKKIKRCVNIGCKKYTQRISKFH
jgi:hypothetical protein